MDARDLDSEERSCDRLKRCLRLVVQATDTFAGLAARWVAGILVALVATSGPMPVHAASALSDAAADPTHNSVVLSWTSPTRESGSLVQYAIGASGGAFGTWTSIPSSQPGGGNAGGYEVPNLSSSTDYAFKLRYTIPSGDNFSPEVETSASTFEPFTGRFLLPSGFFDDSDRAGFNQRFVVGMKFSAALGSRFALVPGRDTLEVGQSDLKRLTGNYGSDAPENTYGVELQARTGATSVPITLKAPRGPKVRCTAEEARATPERPPAKICSADLRPLVANVTGVVRAFRKVVLRLDTTSISENGGVATLDARLDWPFRTPTRHQASDVDVHVDIQIPGDDLVASGTRLTFRAGSRYSNRITLTARDDSEATGNRVIRISAGMPSLPNLATRSNPVLGADLSSDASIDLKIMEDEEGFLAPDEFVAKARFDTVLLTWDPSVNSEAHSYQYRYSSTGAAPDWQDVPDSAVGEANHSGFTVPGLSTETAYTFEIRAKA